MFASKFGAVHHRKIAGKITVDPGLRFPGKDRVVLPIINSPLYAHTFEKDCVNVWYFCSLKKHSFTDGPGKFGRFY